MAQLVTTIARGSTLSRAELVRLEDEIRTVYTSDTRPWVIGYSGGKDSTTTLQLVWQALKGLSPELLTKPVYVISSDTLVETPKIVEYVDTTLKQINAAASAQFRKLDARSGDELAQNQWLVLVTTLNPAESLRLHADRIVFG
jgi:DNA sulfur modification protein DndC